MMTFLILAFVYKMQSLAEIAVIGGLVGFFFIPTPSILISYASEVVFPIDESSSAGYLFAASQTFGFLMGLGSISYLNQTVFRSKLIGFITIGVLVLSFLSAAWVK